MSKHRLTRPSPAFVLAAIALVAALDGPAIARETAHLAKEITGSKIARNAITSSKIARNAVTSAKVKDGSLLAKDFKTGQIPAGPQGPRGATGTVDTSQFYSRSDSDARFLGIAATATNATELAGVGAGGYVANGSSGTAATVQSNEIKDTSPGPNLVNPVVDTVLTVPGFGTLQSKCSNVGSPPTNVAMQLDFTRASGAADFAITANESNFIPSLTQPQTNQVKVATLSSASPTYNLTATGGGFQLLSSNGTGRGVTQATIQLMRDRASGAFDTATIEVTGVVSLSNDDCQAAATAITSSK
jgi:hypothetical protein